MSLSMISGSRVPEFVAINTLDYVCLDALADTEQLVNRVTWEYLLLIEIKLEPR